MIRYFEELTLGQTFGGPQYFLDAEEIIEFAQKYDPQSFHTEPSKAPESFFGQHVASGWQTTSIGMRLLVTGEHHFAGGMIGLGVEGIRWRRPTLPGMTLKMVSEIIQLSRSGKFPRHGLVKLKNVISDATSGAELAEMTTLQIVELKAPPQP
jgi:acyl dehydratase